MLIKTRMRAPLVLLLEAYTFSEMEWMALDDVLGRAELSTEYSPLGRDNFGRDGRRYIVETLGRIEALAHIIEGRFDSTGRFAPDQGTGRTYACREVKHRGMGNGCQEFAAPDNSTAIVRCGIIAGQQK